MKVLERIRAKWRDESGQSLVLVALLMVAILGVTAIVLDGAYAFAQRRWMQNAADAAAMAGARALARGATEGEAYQMANRYATLNGADEADITINGITVTVRTRHTFPAFFAGIMGLPQMTAQAEAQASFSAISSVRGIPLWPMAVHEDNIIQNGFDNPIAMWDSAREGPGNFGWVDFNGGSNPTPEQREWLENGFTPGPDNRVLLFVSGDRHSDSVEAPELNLRQFEGQDYVWILGTPGIRASLESVAAQHIGREVNVLVYDESAGQGNNFRFRIVGFAAFEVQDVDFHGHPKQVEGLFLRYVQLGRGGGSRDFGLRTVNLVR